MFFRAHTGLPREAPGSEATTLLLLRLAGELPPGPRIVDLGSGAGPAAVPLAVATGGAVTAVDLHRPFLDDLLVRAERAGVSDRVSAIVADMSDPPLDEASVDLIWAEGSAYAIGFDVALTAWRRFLAPGGRLVLTEAEWAVPDPSDEARAFWAEGYPAMRDTAGNVAAATAAGYRVLAVYRLPASDWAAYYGPLAVRLDELRAAGEDPELLDAVGAEIGVWERSAGDYSYTGYVLTPR